MPPTKALRCGHPQPVKAGSQSWSIPDDFHLIITTPKRVISWNHNGLRTTFKSSSAGILVAKESKDGSGVLAIADSQVVLLHDERHDINKSHSLNGSDGNVRLLEFASDSALLYFSTTLLNGVQIYSIPQTKLLEPAYSHSSPPTALALSPTAHLLLSASASPPTIYLQNLVLRTVPTLILPRASTSPVVRASFHPDRANIFLLAFRDGIVAAYDATRIQKRKGEDVHGQGLNDGEIGHFKGLHHVTSGAAATPSKRTHNGTKCSGITGAAFLPGYRTRAVTVGSDGRCRIIDFASGGKILRTWHVRGPATSVSILPIKTQTGNARRGGAKSQVPANSSLKALIAVGRLDGKVLLFDSLGLLICEQVIDREAGNILNVEWMNGSGPNGAQQGSENKATRDTAQVDENHSSEEESTSGNLTIDKHGTRKPLEWEDEPADVRNVEYHEYSTTEFTGNNANERSEDCMDSGTVQRHAMPEMNQRQAPIGPTGTLMDLFSPIKAHRSPVKRSPTRLVVRPRPRLSSSTFVNRNIESTFNLPTLSPGRHDGNTSDPSLGTQKDIPRKPVVATPAIRKKRRSSARLMPGAYLSSTSLLTTASSSSSQSAKILSELKRLGAEKGRTKQRPGGLSVLAPYIQSVPGHSQHSVLHDSSAQQDQSILNRTKVLLEKHDHAGQDDIWLTSESETETCNTQQRRTRSSQHSGKQSRTDRRKDHAVSSDTAWETCAVTPTADNCPSSSSLYQDASTSSDDTGYVYPYRTRGLGFPGDIKAQETAQHSSNDTVTYNTAHELPPGSAHSPHVPKDVSKFFPRRSSMFFANGKSGTINEEYGPGSGSSWREEALECESDSTSFRSHIYTNNENRGSGQPICNGCHSLRVELHALRDEVMTLRAEVARIQRQV